MSEGQLLDLWRHALETVAFVAGPFILGALAVGLVIAIFQAATQIQEQTLAFVPKIFAMGLAVIFVMPWMFQRLLEYTHHLFTMGGG